MTDTAVPREHGPEVADLLHLIYASVVARQLEPVWIARLEARLEGRVVVHNPDLPCANLHRVFEALVDSDCGLPPVQGGFWPGAYWAAHAEFEKRSPAAEAHRELSRSGFADAMALQAQVGVQTQTVLSLHRPASAGPLSADQGVMLHHLTPHFVRAFHLRGRLDLAADAGLAAEAALGLDQSGFLLVDGRRRVLLESAFVESAYQAGVLSCSGGVLTASNDKASELLHRAMDVATRTARPKSSTFSIQTQGGPYNILVAPISGLNNAQARHGRALIRLSRPRSVTVEELRQEYGLTPSEAALLCGLINGQRLADYAQSTGLQMSTVKTHLRGVFMKTGEQRQSDLIRRVLTDLLVGEPTACS